MLSITESQWYAITAFILILAQLRPPRPHIGRSVIIIFVWRDPSLIFPLLLCFDLLPDDIREQVALVLTTAFTWPSFWFHVIGSLPYIFKLLLKLFFFFVVAPIVLLITAIGLIIKYHVIDPPTAPSSTAHSSMTLSAMEMNEKFLDGLTCPFGLYIADSKLSRAGSGLFVRKEVPAGKEIFRVRHLYSILLPEHCPILRFFPQNIVQFSGVSPNIKRSMLTPKCAG